MECSQGRSDGVSRVSTITGPQPKGTHQRRKFTLYIFEKVTKSRKITNFRRFAYSHETPATALNILSVFWSTTYLFFFAENVSTPKKILLEPLREMDEKWLFLESLKYIYLNHSRKSQEFVRFYWSGTSKCT
jgi:hypothetical protein